MGLVYADQRISGNPVYGSQQVVGGDVAPAFTVQPSPVALTAGAAATFGPVSASGSPTPTYQWQRAPSGSGTFADISGATGTSYTTPAATVSGGSANSGDQYRCVASSTAGTANSNAVTLTVSAVSTAPAFTTQPNAVTLTVGGAATFGPVAASGSPTPTYQWQRMTSGGSFADISGATSASYTTAATTVTGGSANSGDQYRCVASSTAGTANSNAVTLTVNTTADTTPPTFVGPVTASAITQTSYTLTWPAATDAGGLAGYDLSLNGGSFTSLGNVLTTAISGRTAGATDAVQVRARDTSGNVTTLSLNVPLQAAPVGLPPNLGLAPAIGRTVTVVVI